MNINPYKPQDFATVVHILQLVSNLGPSTFSKWPMKPLAPQDSKKI